MTLVAPWLSHFSRSRHSPGRRADATRVPPDKLSGKDTRPATGPSGSNESEFQREDFLARLRDFFYGMTGWEFECQARELRGALENVFLTVTLGDMLGLPILPPIYSLRLLPYVVPNIASWKRRVSRPRELPESEEFDLHGV